MNEQWGIALCGVIAVALSQDHNPSRRRYACLFGLAGQPFWFYAAWHSQQWGIALVTVLYTLAWSRGVWSLWLRRHRHHHLENAQGSVCACCDKAVAQPQDSSAS